jgi:hypothetical protein
MMFFTEKVLLDIFRNYYASLINGKVMINLIPYVDTCKSQFSSIACIQSFTYISEVTTFLTLQLVVKMSLHCPRNVLPNNSKHFSITRVYILQAFTCVHVYHGHCTWSLIARLCDPIVRSSDLQLQTVFFKSFLLLLLLRPILNFTPGSQGITSPLGENLAPRGELCPLGVKFTPSFTPRGEHSLFFSRMEGRTENFTPGPRG